jgi:hypothetical protein
LSLILVLAAACGLDGEPSSGNGNGAGDGIGEGEGEGIGEGEGDGEGEPEVEECVYPDYSGALRLGEIMPPFAWNDAFLGNGDNIDLNLFEWYCLPDDEAENSLVLVVGAGWCPNCPDYIRNVDDMSSSLQANKALVVYMEMQTPSRALSTNQEAHDYVTRLIGDAYGIRVGDAATLPSPGAFAGSSDITGVPTAFIVDRETMEIIGDQGATQYYLDFIGLTGDPSTPMTGGGTVELNCGDSDEEPFEPNNYAEDAGLIEAGDNITGGVCDFEPDFYKIEIEGDWQFDIFFSTETGDLDMYVWDPVNNQPVQEGGNWVGSDTITDNESLQYTGPAVIMVYGYQRATTTYSLTLNQL